MEEAAYFRTEAEDIKDAVEEADLEDVAEVDLAVAKEEEEIIGTVDKITEWCNETTDKNWRFTRHMMIPSSQIGRAGMKES